MIQSKVPGRRLLLGLAMAVVAVVATTTATAAVGKATATPIKFAIMSDCGGAFAANYEQDIGGAIIGRLSVRRGEAEQPEQAVRRMARGLGRRPSAQARGHRLRERHG